MLKYRSKRCVGVNQEKGIGENISCRKTIKYRGSGLAENRRHFRNKRENEHRELKKK